MFLEGLAQQSGDDVGHAMVGRLAALRVLVGRVADYVVSLLVSFDFDRAQRGVVASTQDILRVRRYQVHHALNC